MDEEREAQEHDVYGGEIPEEEEGEMDADTDYYEDPVATENANSSSKVLSQINQSVSYGILLFSYSFMIRNWKT